MLNIMPMTTAIMPQFIHNFIVYIVQLDSRVFSSNFYLLCQDTVFLFLTFCAQQYAPEKTCALFYTKLWLQYYMTEFIKKACFKILPIMLPLCLMLLVTYFAQYYAGIIGLGLAIYVNYYYVYCVHLQEGYVLCFLIYCG